MMNKKDKNYNWWEDPANAKEVKRLSWWEHEKNKTTVEIPVSIAFDGKHYTITANKETDKLFGKYLHACTSGETREEAIQKWFEHIKWISEFDRERWLKYEKFVPLIVGPWKSIGGKWFTCFGLRFYFRYGKNMQGGWYVPFTKLNILFSNLWLRKIEE